MADTDIRPLNGANIIKQMQKAVSDYRHRTLPFQEHEIRSLAAELGVKLDENEMALLYPID